MILRTPRIFFTADTHFGHAGILSHPANLFNNTDERDHALITNWNRVVGPHDPIFHLGDVSYWRGSERQGYFDHILSQLNGDKYLIRGNHDNWLSDSLAQKHFVQVFEQLVLKVPGYGPNGSILHIHLLHAPLRTWYFRRYGGIHLHGHVHGFYNVDPILGTVDVGVEPCGFYPITLHEALVRAGATAFWEQIRKQRDYEKSIRVRR